MDRKKRERLDAAGWTVGSAKEFLGLEDAEAALIEVKLTLSQALRKKRKRGGISQVELARRLRSSQSRVAKMEAGDPSVSIELIVRSLLALGATRRELASAIAPRKTA
jgi:ribosome-binding protein aMBF1 (putative translation factor)